MGIAQDVDAALKAFESANPKLKGKAYPTSGDRPWEEQLDIILDPKRAKNYTNIKARFLKAFKLDKLPKDAKALPADQLVWWKKEIMAQAGKSPGFPHVGGKAQDVSVKSLAAEEKKLLVEAMKAKGIKILFEKVTNDESVYGVPLASANVFHCTR